MQLDDVPRISARRRRGSTGAAARARAQRARGAGMRVDEPGADRRSGPEAHRRRGLGRQSLARAARLAQAICGADAGVMVVLEEPEPNAVEEFVRPALLMREIAEFAGRRAGRAGQRPGRPKREEIGEVEEMAGLGEGLGHVSREPERASAPASPAKSAADIAQSLMPAGVDPLGIFDGAMIHPDDHVAFGRIGRAHRQRTRIAIERDQRTGRVEAHAADRLGRQTRRLDRLAHGRGNRAPDVVGRLLDDVARLAPDGDRSPGAGDQPPGGIENAGPRAQRADVHSDIGLAHVLLPGVKSGRRVRRFPPRWQAAAVEAGHTRGFNSRTSLN